MFGAYGFHNHTVVTGVKGDVGRHGQYKLAEVTSEADTLFYPNYFTYETNNGILSAIPRPGVKGIPLKAGVPKVIPMAVYNFKADAVVTVVAYGS